MELTTIKAGSRIMRHIQGLPAFLAINIGLNLAQWAYLAWRVHPQTDLIPLHYTIAFGIDRIGPWQSAYLLPASGTAMLLGNILLSTLLVQHHRATAIFLIYFTMFLEVILLAGALLVFRQL